MAVDTIEMPAKRRLALRDVRASAKIKSYIEKANEQMAAIGFTEHGLRHAALVAAIARNTCGEAGSVSSSKLPSIMSAVISNACESDSISWRLNITIFESS